MAARLNLQPIRTGESVRLDGKTVKPRGLGLQVLPPYAEWKQFDRWFGATWNRDLNYGAEHVVLVGQAGSGKTTLAVKLLRFQPYVVVLGTKMRDPSLYAPLQAQGFEIMDKFDPTAAGKHPRVIFRPPLSEPTAGALWKQSQAFEKALIGVFSTGGWAIYMDEVRYLTEQLKLGDILNTLWLQGRSLWVTMIAATQRPVSIPINAFEQATHSFLFRTTGRNDRIRASEYQGISQPVVYETLARLPHHEVLYIDSIHDYLVRTQVRT